MTNRPGQFEPLLSDQERAGAAAAAPAGPTVSQRLQAAITPYTSSPKFMQRLGAGVVALTMLALCVSGYLYWERHHKPNYALDPIDDVAEFTFLRDDFNNLSIDERLKLIREFADRIRSATSSDSAMLASFAAGISGKAREQIAANASRLMLDMVDRSALEYANLTGSDREKFLEKSVIEWTRIADQVGGRGDRTDEEILADVKKETEQREKMRERMGPERSARMASGIMSFLNNNVAKHSNPIQQQRTLQMMADVNKHFSRKR